MGWQDAPIVGQLNKPMAVGWQSAPLVNPPKEVTPQQGVPTVDYLSKRGVLDGSGDSVASGAADSAVPAVSSENIPEVGSAKELNELTMPAFASSLGLLFSGDEEGATGVLKRQFPDATFSKSSDGDELVTLPSGTYRVRGLGQQVISSIGQGLSFVPAGRVAAGAASGAKLGTMAGAQALGAAGTQAGIEATETALGGEFDAKDVLLAGAMGGASEYVTPAFQSLRRVFTSKPSGAAGSARIEPTFGDAVDEAIKQSKPKSTINSETVKNGAAPEAADYEEISSLLKKGKANLAAMRARPDAEIKEAADDLGIILNPGAYSTNRAFQEAEQALKSVPGSTISTREANAIIELGKRSDDLISKMGGTRDLSLIDNKLQNEFLENIGNLEKQSSNAYAAVDKAIPKVMKVNPRSSKAYIENRLKEYGGDESLLSAAEKQLLRFSKQETPPTYAALDRVRKDVGQGYKGKGIFKDDDQGILDQVYRVLSEDQQGVADAIGAGSEYAAARKLVQTRKALEDEAISLFGRNFNQSLIPKFTGAASSLTKGDISKLDNLMAAIPSHRRQEVSAAMLSEIFTAGARSQKEGVGQGFVNAYANLNRNKLAKDALFKYLPDEARDRFDKIGKVATGLFRAKNLENTSKTARDIISAMDNGGLFSKVYDVGGKVAVAEGVSTSVGLPGVGAAGVLGAALTKSKKPATQAADELLTSKAFERAMIKAMNNAEGEAENIIKRSTAFKRWMNAIDEETSSQVIRSGFIPWITGQQEATEGQQNEQ